MEYKGNALARKFQFLQAVKKIPTTKKEAVPGVEPGLPESESGVVTAGPHGLMFQGIF
jgi:hypothetical protein